MCYAIPGRIVSINGTYADVDYFGEVQRVRIDLIRVVAGDYIFAQGGIAISRVDPDEAVRSLGDWQEMFDQLRNRDAQLSSRTSLVASPRVQSLIARAARGILDDAGAAQLLVLSDQSEIAALCESANQVRWQHHGNASCVHGIIEFSNYCACTCGYCGIRASREIPRYRLTIDEIVHLARSAVDSFGFKAILVQSGEDAWFDEETLEMLVRRLRELDILVFLSIGIRPVQVYQRLYDAGARAVLLRFETSNARLFSDHRPGTEFSDRLALIRSVKKIGYVLATGFLLGLPGETDQDVVNNIRLTCELDPDMYSFGPLIPTRDTPLEGYAPVAFERIRKVIAITRLLSPRANILVTTAMETLHPDAARQALLAGANSLMLNLTPEIYRQMYRIYDGRAWASASVADQIARSISLLKDLGRSPMDVSARAVDSGVGGNVA